MVWLLLRWCARPKHVETQYPPTLSVSMILFMRSCYHLAHSLAVLLQKRIHDTVA